MGKSYKLSLEGYSTVASLDIFGDRVNIVSEVTLGRERKRGKGLPIGDPF